jgi:UDP-glucose 4-epimerase
MNVLITGGFGFVGVQLVRDLSENYTCYILDNEFTGSQRKELLEDVNYNHINCDISDNQAVKKVFKDNNFDCVIHLAAKHLIPWCERNNAEAYKTNVVGTINLLNYMSNEAKFIFISSAAVYAASDEPLIEDESKLEPFDIYGLTKLHGEHITAVKCKQRSINYTNVRLFNVIGPFESNGHILPDICFQLKTGITKLKLGNTSSFRDFIGVQDVSYGLNKIMHISESGHTVNLCSGITYSMDEIIAEVKNVSGIEFTIERDPMRQRKSDNPYIKGSTAKLRMLTGWTPNVSLKDSVRSAWSDDWTSENWDKVIK